MIDIDKLDLKKSKKVAKSYNLEETLIEQIKKLADQNNNSESAILNKILNSVFKL